MPYSKEFRIENYKDIEVIVLLFKDLCSSGPGERQVRILSGIAQVRWRIYDFLHHMSLQKKIQRPEWKVKISSEGLLTLSFSKIKLEEQKEGEIPSSRSVSFISEEAFQLAQKYLAAFGPEWLKWPQVQNDLNEDIRSSVFEALKTLIPSAPPQEMEQTSTRTSR